LCIAEGFDTLNDTGELLLEGEGGKRNLDLANCTYVRNRKTDPDQSGFDFIFPARL
jgi:hypothetical protein